MPPKPKKPQPFAWLTTAANDNAKYKPKKLNCEKRYPGKMSGSQTKNPY